MKKQLIAAGVATTIGIAGLGAGMANAETSSTTSKTDPMSGLVDKIATRFNLNKDEVQKVFDEQRIVMEAEREQKTKDRVAKLVADGKLTLAQADLINAKRAEIQKNREANRESLEDKTDEERKMAREAERTELESWAKENGIDTQYLKYVMGHSRGSFGGLRHDK